ncbi:hypothetical protein SESBI_39445 [Sesbania bispinosa]|nr:hypothetical protein SESBI_39445 [Sesbania bispinosa]
MRHNQYGTKGRETVVKGTKNGDTVLHPSSSPANSFHGHLQTRFLTLSQKRGSSRKKHNK